MENNLDGEELDNIIVLNDEDGNEVKFEFFFKNLKYFI